MVSRHVAPPVHYLGNVKTTADLFFYENNLNYGN